MNKSLLSLPLLAALLLTGCGPNDEEMKAALQASYAEANDFSTSLLGEGGKIEVLSVKRLECEKQDAAYTCSFEMETRLPLVGRQKKATTARFAKGKDGWVVLQ